MFVSRLTYKLVLMTLFGAFTPLFHTVIRQVIIHLGGRSKISLLYRFARAPY